MALPHAVLACINPDRVVHDAVENRVGDGVATQLSVPFLGRQLRGERRADGVAPELQELQELQEESFEWFVGLVDEPFVDREQVYFVKSRWTLSALNLDTVGVQLEHHRRPVPCFVVWLAYFMRECLFR